MRSRSAIRAADPDGAEEEIASESNASPFVAPLPVLMLKHRDAARKGGDTVACGTNSIDHEMRLSLRLRGLRVLAGVVGRLLRASAGRWGAAWR
jgi:hypothetical protein